MSFSLDDAWRETAALLRANRSMLLPIGGAFYLIPLTLYAFVAPEFVPPQSQDQQVVARELAAYLSTIALPLLLLGAVTTLGTAVIYHLLLDRDRPTVGRAIAAGVRTWPLLILLAIVLGLAQLVLLIATSFAAGFLGLPPQFATLAFVGFLIASVYVVARFVPAGPGIVAERFRSPGRFLRYGLYLTSRDGWRIALFLFALLVASLILMFAIQIVLGGALVLLAGDAGRQMSLVLSAVLLGAALVVFTVAYVAVYRCLAGPPDVAPAGT